jgi:hypothetical protein
MNMCPIEASQLLYLDILDRFGTSLKEFAFWDIYDKNEVVIFL